MMPFGIYTPFFLLEPHGKKKKKKGSCSSSKQKKGKETNDGLKGTECSLRTYCLSVGKGKLFTSLPELYCVSPLSCKGGLGLGTFCVAAQVIDDERKKLELFWRAQPWSLPQE